MSSTSPIPGMQLVDEFEKAFMDCFSILNNPESENAQDMDEINNSADFALQHLKDVSVQMDAFFLQRRLLASVQKPDHFLAESIQELQLEVKRKDALLDKYHTKLESWRRMMREVADTPGFSLSEFSSMIQDPSLYPAPQNQMPSTSAQGSSVHPIHMMPDHNIPTMQPVIPMSGPPLHPQYMGNTAAPPPPPPPAAAAAALHGPLGYMERSMSNLNMPSGSG